MDNQIASERPVSLGIFIHVLAWVGRVFFIFFALWVIYRIFEYGIFFEAVITIVSVFVIAFLAEKVNFTVSIEEHSIANKLIYYLVTILLWLVAGISVPGSLLIFLSEIRQIFIHAPLLLAMSLVVVPIVVLAFNWVLDLKSWKK